MDPEIRRAEEMHTYVCFCEDDETFDTEHMREMTYNEAKEFNDEFREKGLPFHWVALSTVDYLFEEE